LLKGGLHIPSTDAERRLLRIKHPIRTLTAASFLVFQRIPDRSGWGNAMFIESAGERLFVIVNSPEGTARLASPEAQGRPDGGVPERQKRLHAIGS